MKLPGKDSRTPQSFPFGTPYVKIRDYLAGQNEALFRRNSVLGLLERDAATKRAPERWQALASEDVASFDVVVCFESRVFDLVVEGTTFFPCCCRCSGRCCCCGPAVEVSRPDAEEQVELALGGSRVAASCGMIVRSGKERRRVVDKKRFEPINPICFAALIS